ncbi:MAG: glutathione-disulfide reductase [Prochloraceae cyanobacterium]|nr:glutathione-disulfide reductase [Prochloraceae cyanobacterium]
MSYDFDLFVIGGGSGGIACARRAAEYGAKVGLAENDRLGGTCVHRGCIPKKLMVYASRFPAQFEEATGYGWSKPESHLNWSQMVRAVNNELDRLNGVYQRMLDKSNVQLFRGYAQFVDSHTVAIGDRKVSADKIIVAVGGRPVKPNNIPGIDLAVVSDDMFNLPEQPKSLVIIGGGYIGVEFACIMQGLGTQVTQIIRADRILRGFDGDLRSTLTEAMEKHGIRIFNNSNQIEIEKTDEGVKVISRSDKEDIAVADAVSLAATGRKPNLENLGLENTGVEIVDGAIAVNEISRTSEPNIYAIGDCTPTMELTPVAIREGRIFADTHFGKKDAKMSYENIPTAVFSTPEAATVGLTEEDAKAKYGDEAIKIYRAKFRPLYHTLSGQDEKTLMKLVVNRDTDKVLGAHMVGEHSGEIMQAIAISLKMGATKADFDATVALHPSSAEEFVTMR